MKPTVSYLGGMPTRERAASVVLALKSYGNLTEIYLGGERQFLQIARPILRNWGVGRGDYGVVWAMIEFAMKDWKGFQALCEAMDKKKRLEVH